MNDNHYHLRFQFYQSNYFSQILIVRYLKLNLEEFHFYLYFIWFIKIPQAFKVIYLGSAKESFMDQIHLYFFIHLKIFILLLYCFLKMDFLTYCIHNLSQKLNLNLYESNLNFYPDSTLEFSFVYNQISRFYFSTLSLDILFKQNLFKIVNLHFTHHSIQCLFFYLQYPICFTPNFLFFLSHFDSK